jgi:hypothetical protein
MLGRRDDASPRARLIIRRRQRRLGEHRVERVLRAARLLAADLGIGCVEFRLLVLDVGQHLNDVIFTQPGYSDPEAVNRPSGGFSSVRNGGPDAGETSATNTTLTAVLPELDAPFIFLATIVAVAGSHLFPNTGASYSRGSSPVQGSTTLRYVSASRLAALLLAVRGGVGRRGGRYGL